MRTTGIGQWLRAVAREGVHTAWPPLMPGKSENQRRKIRQVRGMHLGVALLVGTAVATNLASQEETLPAARLAGLFLASLGFLAWCFAGMRPAVALLLWEEGAPPQRLQAPGRGLEHTLYFAGQLALAAAVFSLGGGRGGASNLLWLVLLPPAAHAVVRLRWPGVLVVCAICLGVLLFQISRHQGWNAAVSTGSLFGFALLFTCLFCQLAVSSERARGEVQRLAAELAAANRQLREYATQAEELSAMRERNRLAREIHDTLGHCLTVVNVQIAAARAVHQSDPTRADAALEQAQSLTQEGLNEVRRSVAALRASPLENRPLAEALRQAAACQCRSGLDAQLEILGTERPLPPQVELTLFRAGQEAMTNTRKHAQATHAWLTLDFRAPQTVRLTARDDGRGAELAAATNAAGFGLLGVRERVQLLGGQLRLNTAPGAGFTLEIEVPT